MNEALNGGGIGTISDGGYAGVWRRSRGGYEWAEALAPPFAGRRQDTEEEGRPGAGPWLRPIGTDELTYAVMQRKAVLDDVIQLGRTVSRATILAFASRYGRLFEPRHDPAEATNLTPATDTHYLDSYGRWRWEAQRVAALWRLWTWVLDGDERQLEPYIRWDTADSTPYLRVMFPGGEPDAELTRRVFPDGDPRTNLRGDALGLVSKLSQPRPGWRTGEILEPARHGIRQQVNARLAGHVFPQVMHFDNDPLRNVPDSLLAAIYAHFALQLIGGGARIRQCENPTCPYGIFVASRRDQRYCSKNCRELGYYHKSKRPQS